MKKLSFTLIVLLMASVFAINTEAKVLPQSVKGVIKQEAVKSAGATIAVFPKLRADRKALIVKFQNLQNAKSVSYLLTYKTAIQQEAAMGALNLKGANDTVELLFGTCSKNVCRYHTNIKDARLEVSYTTKIGKKYLKKFKIKV